MMSFLKKGGGSTETVSRVPVTFHYGNAPQLVISTWESFQEINDFLKTCDYDDTVFTIRWIWLGHRCILQVITRRQGMGCLKCKTHQSRFQWVVSCLCHVKDPAASPPSLIYSLYMLYTTFTSCFSCVWVLAHVLIQDSFILTHLEYIK